MKKYLIILISLVFMVSCKESYVMPNFFKHHENGAVKQITIKTFEVSNGAITPYPENFILIWGESGDGTSTYDKNGNILSDKYYTYNYDENGRLESTETTSAYGQIHTQNVTYNELNEIKQWGDYTYRYNDNNQICAAVENIQAQNYFPASYREYEYNDDGQLKSCNFNHNREIYGSEYNDKGELVRHVKMMAGGRIEEYQVNVTQHDENGNWTERRITGNSYTGRSVEYLQKRELRYY